jgi:HSP20 family molecular chaperone IbpA
LNDFDPYCNLYRYSMEQESEDKKWHRSERREYSEFQQRALRMPENTDFSKMCASYDNGVAVQLLTPPVDP